MRTVIDRIVRNQDGGRPQAGTLTVWLGFIVVLAASVMDLLDSTVAQTAAPAIRADLGGSYASIEWISAGYTLAMAVGLLAGGRLVDIHGRSRVLLAGMGAFVGASVLCALAPTAGSLIAARVLQGGIAALMVPQCFGLIRELFGDEGQQKAFDLASVVMAVLGGGALVYPLIEGRELDWPVWCFALMAAGVVLLGVFLRRQRRLTGRRRCSTRPSCIAAPTSAASPSSSASSGRSAG